ncbi:MAG: CoA pyrophosphatase [Granulosicoccus sp.]|nr:CoA pyrophosphatase [Granulosicoccus sp.]
MHDKLTRVVPHDDDALHHDSDVPVLTPAGQFKQAAVLIPVVQHDDQWQVLFIRRAANKQDRHSGQVAFPGGRLEAGDSTHIAAALRETQEEIGVDPGRVNIVGHIRPYITISHYQVTPIVGVVDWPTTLRLQSSEVARAFLIPLSWLRDQANFTMRARLEMDPLSARRHPIIVYNEFDGEILWGATARMTLNFLKAIDDGKIPLPPGNG